MELKSEPLFAPIAENRALKDQNLQTEEPQAH